jgi:hypothetical protein
MLQQYFFQILVASVSSETLKVADVLQYLVLPHPEQGIEGFY